MIMVLLNRSRASGAGWFNYGSSTATQLPILLQLKLLQLSLHVGS
jgi:hypothetical protein